MRGTAWQQRYEGDIIVLHQCGEERAGRQHLVKMLSDSGNYFAVATHDSRLLDEAAASAAAGQFEFQLLMGIRDELKRDLVGGGFSASEYIPYGEHWLPYSVRRLRERKRNILLLARSLVQD